MDMRASDTLRAGIKNIEKCNLAPHWDAVGSVWDIGYGDVLDPQPIRGSDGRLILPDPITQFQADELFDRRLAQFEDAVNAAITIEVDPEIRQQIFDACLSFAYNVGIDALLKSTFLKYLNAGRFAEAAVELLTWNKAGGKFVEGLLKRRAIEALILMRGEYHL